MCWGLIIQAGQEAMGVGIGAIAGEYQYEATRDAARYNQEIIQRNKELAEFKAKDALSRGAEEASKLRAYGRSLQGAQRTAAAASGVLATSGSPMTAQAQTKYFSDLDAMTIMHNAQKESWAYAMDAANMQTQWNILESQKHWAKWAKNFGLVASILAGTSRFGSQAYQYYGGMNTSTPNYGGQIGSTYSSPYGNKNDLDINWTGNSWTSGLA